MITDNTINDLHAEYWCIFSDVEFREFIMNIAKKNKQNKVDEGIGEFLGFNFTTLGGVIAAISSIMFLKNILTPYISNIWKKMKNSDSDAIAIVNFEADDKNYSALFNIKSMKWMLKSDIEVSETETLQFFGTNFFRKFCTQCLTYIKPVLENKDAILEDIDLLNNSKAKHFITELFKNEKKIIYNMSAVKFIT